MNKILKFLKNIFFKKSFKKKEDENTNENIESPLSSPCKLPQLIQLSTLPIPVPIRIPIPIISSSIESCNSNYKITLENIKPYIYYNRCDICNRKTNLNECNICKDLFCQKCDIVFNGYCFFCKKRN